MKRFEPAIKVINDEVLRQVGKAAQEFAEHKAVHLATQTRKVKALKRAISILENHEENKCV